MGFHETRFPTGISYRSSGGPGYSTAILEVDSGAEERVARWDAARRQYNAAYGVKNYTDLSDLTKFYIARKGPAFGFRYKDFLDCTSTSTGLDSSLGGAAVDDEDQIIGTGDGTETQFQLIKKYTEGGVTRTRNITKPVAGTTIIAIDGAGQGAGWSVDTTTGVVTFSVAPALNEEITAGFEFDVPVRFGKELDDVLSLSIDDFGSGSAQDIPLIEIKDEGEIQDEFFFGGAADLAISANTQVTLQTGRVLRVTPAGAGLKVILPDEAALPTGGPYFYIYNIGSDAISIRDHADAEIVSLAQDAFAILLIVDDIGTNDWLALT